MSQALTKPIQEATTSTPPQGQTKFSVSKLLARIPLWILIALLLIVVIYPLLWLLLSSFKTTAEFNTGAFWTLPSGFAWQNYTVAWTSGMGTYFLNSILVVFPSLFLVLVISLAASFGLEVMKWRFNNVVLLAFLAGIMIPAQMILLPLFTMCFSATLIRQANCRSPSRTVRVTRPSSPRRNTPEMRSLPTIRRVSLLATVATTSLVSSRSFHSATDSPIPTLPIPIFGWNPIQARVPDRSR